MTDRGQSQKPAETGPCIVGGLQLTVFAIAVLFVAALCLPWPALKTAVWT